jgi:hypothetical protein
MNRPEERPSDLSRAAVMLLSTTQRFSNPVSSPEIASLYARSNQVASSTNTSPHDEQRRYVASVSPRTVAVAQVTVDPEQTGQGVGMRAAP